MERICFVIMPFSETDSCTTRQWTHIFNTLFKRTIEEANLGYECRRSTATRGSIIKGIVSDLSSSYVVLADLTDQNPNVFYELGIRHALGPRTILIAQNRKHIPFDLRGYASHVYDWRSTSGRSKFKSKIVDIFKEIDRDGERSDNPVSDFLVRTNTSLQSAHRSRTNETAVPIVGPNASNLDISDIVKRMAEENRR